MKKRIFLAVFLFLLGFTYYMSPSFMGLIPGGKETHDKSIFKIVFNTKKEVAFTIPYTLKNNQESLIELRKTFQIDTLVQVDNSAIENVKSVQAWVHTRWKHDGDNTPENYDPIYILKAAEKGEQFRCVEYSLVTTACLQSLGYLVRNVGLMTRDVNEVNIGAGHVVSEVYLPDLQKWFFIDPQFDIMAIQNGIPLNLVEFQHAIAHNESFELINTSKSISDEAYIDWVSPYLFYLKTALNNGNTSVWDRIIGNKRSLLLVPNNYDPPTYFQRLFRMKTFIPTHSVSDFYPKPILEK